jgi:hypothetical protein
MYAMIIPFIKKHSVIIARVLLFIVFIKYGFSLCHAQLCCSGYPFINLNTNGPKWGGTFGIGNKSGYNEYWLNMELTYRTETVTIPSPYQYFPSSTIETNYTTMALAGMYHYDIVLNGDKSSTFLPFVEIGAGLDFTFYEVKGANVFSFSEDNKGTDTGLMLACALGIDIEKKVRIRFAPFTVSGNASRSGFQLSIFWLFNYPSYEVVTE